MIACKSFLSLNFAWEHYWKYIAAEKKNLKNKIKKNVLFAIFIFQLKIAIGVEIKKSSPHPEGSTKHHITLSINGRPHYKLLF